MLFFYRWQNTLNLCKSLREQGLKEPYCFSQCFPGQACRRGYSQEQLKALIEHHKQSSPNPAQSSASCRKTKTDTFEEDCKRGLRALVAAWEENP
jgi:hypothetical protein